MEKRKQQMPQVGEHWERASGDPNGITVLAVTPDNDSFGGYDIKIEYDYDVGDRVYHKDLGTFWSRFYLAERNK
jgi:hypothetical protein